MYCFRSVVAILFFLISESCISADINAWSFWVEQGGQKFQPGSVLVLARKPFSINFKGPIENDYGLAATTMLEELPSTDDLSSVFRWSNGLLIDDPNTKISINGLGLIKKGWSSWNMWAYHAPTEIGLISGFQIRTVNQDKTVTLTRRIDSLCLDDGQHDVCKPIVSTDITKFHALVTRIPQLRADQSIKDTSWLDPRVISIEFR